MIGKTILDGLRLENVTFGRGCSSFEFEGFVGGKSVRYKLSTTFEICFRTEDIFIRDVVDDNTTSLIWAYIERYLKNITLSPDERVCNLLFDNHKSIYVYSKEERHDNLLIARDNHSKDWFTIG